MYESFTSRKVIITERALEAIAWLVDQLGPVVFFQSGGEAEGSLLMCFREGELVIGDRDVYLGSVGGIPYYIDIHQYAHLEQTQLVLDVREGRSNGLSLPAGPNLHFVISARSLSGAEPIGAR